MALRKLLEAKDAAVRAVLSVVLLLWAGAALAQSKEIGAGDGPKAAAPAASRNGLPTVVFVATRAADHPDLVAAFDGRATLEQRPELNGSATPRVSIIAKNGRDEFFTRAENVTAETPAKLLKAWAESEADPAPPPVSPTDPPRPVRPPPKAGVGEETRRAGPRSGATATGTGGNASANVTVNVGPGAVPVPPAPARIVQAPDPTLPFAVQSQPPPVVVHRRVLVQPPPPPPPPAVVYERRYVYAEAPPVVYDHSVYVKGAVVSVPARYGVRADYAPYGARLDAHTWNTESGDPPGPGILAVPGARWPADGPVRAAFRRFWGFDSGGRW